MARLTEEYCFTCPCGHQGIVTAPGTFTCDYCGRPLEILWKADYMVLPAGGQEN